MAKRFIAGSDGQHDAGAGEFALIFPFLPVLAIAMVEMSDVCQKIRIVDHPVGVDVFDGTAVPIMQSRVTRAASSASLSPSVPCGRLGRTM